jgi:hypothetical protein
MHLTWFRHLNKFLSPDFEDRTDSYVVIQSENTRYAWAGGTFFSVVLLCQLCVLAGNRFWFYILLMMYLEYHTVVVLC